MLATEPREQVLFARARHGARLFENRGQAAIAARLRQQVTVDSSTITAFPEARDKLESGPGHQYGRGEWWAIPVSNQ
jgi:hypothetical protein